MTKVKEFKMQFQNFDNNKADETGMTVLHDWVKTYDFQKEDSPIGSFQNKIVTINIWSASGYDKTQNRTYGGMFAYTEVINEDSGEVYYQQFFGETSEDDAFRWANDKAIKVLY